MGDLLSAILSPIVGGIASMFTGSGSKSQPAKERNPMQYVAPTGGKSYISSSPYSMSSDKEDEQLKQAFKPYSGSTYP